MTKKNSRKRRNPTITFQPDDVVSAAIEAALADARARKVDTNPTKLINQTLRQHLRVAAEADAAADAARQAILDKARGVKPD